MSACLLAGCGDDCDTSAAPTATVVVPSATLTAAPLPTTAAPSPSSTPTPSLTPTATASEFDVVISEPRFIIPSDALPVELEALHSNNNVDIVFYEGRLYLAWRTAPHHFAGPDTHLYIMSSADNGTTWQFEHDVFLATDMREPRLLGYAGYLQLMFFEAGSDSGNFEPRKLWRTRRLGAAQWTELELLTDGGEVPWDLKVRNGVAYRTSYQGEHYGAGDTSEIEVFFKQSTDGTAWTPVGGKPNVYFGGVSEVAFEFDADGALWAVTRNEDGDASGFGSHVCYAPPNDLSAWECSERTDPDRYDSPEMFRHGDDLYLVARRDIGGPYDAPGDDELTLAERRGRYLVAYSLRPKRTALYKIDRQQRRVVHVIDLPGVGDCSFPSVQQTGPHTFLLANYTSPLDDPDISWLRGQTSERGTQIYLATLTFEPYFGPPRSATPTWTPTPTPTPLITETPLRIDMAPVFAAPGEPLSIDWPDAEISALVTLGDGTTIDDSVTTHTYAATGDTIFPIGGSLQIGTTTLPVAGGVARTNTRATTPLNGFTLTEPSEDVVVNVIRGVLPAFYFAFDADTLAIAADATATGNPRFDDVGVASMTRASDGTFTSTAIDFALELSVPGGTPTGLIVHLLDASWSGRFEGAAVTSPIQLQGHIVVEDIVRAAEVLADLDHEAALGFIAGLLNFDPLDPPVSVPFRGDMAVEAGSASLE